MSLLPGLVDRPRVLVVGGGYVGLYVAFGLQKKLQRAGKVLTLVDPLPYMTYQPFLPEVGAGSIEPRHAVVSFREHLPQTEYIHGSITSVDHTKRVASVQVNDENYDIPYEQVVMAAGAITRTFPIPGLAKEGIGLKTIEEAVTVRNQVLECLERACTETDPQTRRRLLTFVVVGGGFAGIETLGELEDLARSVVKKNPRLRLEELHFVLIEAMGRIMPEVTAEQAEWVVEHLRGRGIDIRLNTSLAEATDGTLTLVSMPDKKPAGQLETDTLIWTAGVRASPVAKSTTFPVDERGRIHTGADLRITGNDGPIEHAWAAGDIAAVPDLTGEGVGGYCVPNAQHAVRQAKLLAKNLWAAERGQPLADYRHKTIGVVAGLGIGKGVARVGKAGFRGAVAWLMHRGYHGLAMPTVERKIRVIGNWVLSFILGRDASALVGLTSPWEAFQASAEPAKRPSEESP